MRKLWRRTVKKILKIYLKSIKDWQSKKLLRSVLKNNQIPSRNGSNPSYVFNGWKLYGNGPDRARCEYIFFENLHSLT